MYLTRISLILVFGLSLAACNNDSDLEEEAESSMNQWERNFEQAGDQIAAGWEDLKEATHEQRARVTSSLNRASEKMENHFEEWKRSGRDFSEGAQENFREAKQSFENQLEKLEQSSEENWAEAKESANQAWEKLKQAYDNLKEDVQG